MTVSENQKWAAFFPPSYMLLSDTNALKAAWCQRLLHGPPRL